MEPENVSTELNDDGAKSVEIGDDNQAAENKDRVDVERRRKGGSSRSRSRERRRRDSRSRDRHRHRRRRSKSRSRDRYYSKSERRRSRSRDYGRSRRRSRDRYYRSRRRYSSDEDGYGYKSRRGGKSSELDRMAAVEDPFAKLRTATAAAADPAEVQRKMQEQQLRARQLVLQQQAASAVAAASKTQREVYVGGLAAGVVTEQMLHNLFRTTLTSAFPEKCKGGVDPVIRINMAAEGKYCFIELLSSDMATACLELTGQISLMGSMLAIGRPTGYVDPAKAQNAAQLAADTLAKFQADSQVERLASGALTPESLGQEATAFLCILGMVSPDVLSSDSDYLEVLDDLKAELEKHGTVLRVIIPRPEDPSQSDSLFGTGQYGKALVQYLESEAAAKAKESIHGRIFDGREIQVSYMQPQEYLDAIAISPPVQVDEQQVAPANEQ